MTLVPVVLQFRRFIRVAIAQSQELVSSFRRLVGTLLPGGTAGKNIVVTMRLAIDALLPPKELLAHTLHQVLLTSSSHKKTLVSVGVGLIGLGFFFSVLEISVRRELAKENTDATIDAVPAAPTSFKQIEFAERFAIQPRTISLEAVDLSGTAGATTVSDDVQTVGRGSREAVPLPRPRKHR